MKVLEPTVACLCNLKIEHACVDNLLDIDLSVAGLNDLGPMVQLLY